MLSEETLLLSGALNSVSGEWPKCLFRASRCRSHRGDRTLQVAQVSGAIHIHGEAIYVPLSARMSHTQLRLTKSRGRTAERGVMA